MQIIPHFFIVIPNYSAYLPNKMHFFEEKYTKHLLNPQIFRNFVAEFAARAMTAPVSVCGIVLCCEGIKPL